MREGLLRHRIRLAVLATLAALSLFVFGQVRSHPFIGLDDTRDIAGNPSVRAGLTAAGVRWAFSVGHPPYWHPLTTLSHMADVEAFGMDAGRHLLVNVALHFATAALFFFVVGTATGRWWSGALAAALFVVHPLRVESVAWAAERKDVLSGLFWMSALLAALWYARRPTVLRFAAVAALFGCGLLAKPVLVVFPLVLLVLDAWPLDRVRTAGVPRVLLEKLPLALLAVPVGMITASVVKQTVFGERAFPLAERLANAAVAAAGYLGQVLWPTSLAVFYPHPASSGGHTPGWQLGVAVALLVCISGGAWMLRRSRPWIFAGWAWYLATLAPTLGIIQNWEQAHADRFTYLPLAGIFWIVAEEAALLFARRPRLRRAVTAAGVAVVAALAVAARSQVGIWRDPEKLFRHAISVTRDNWLACSQLGVVLLRQGRDAEAEPLLRKAISLRPLFPVARNNLGILLGRSGRREEAAREYETALQQDPGYTEARVNLGTLRWREGRHGDAIEQYRRALAGRPGFAPAQLSLGLVLEEVGRRDEAVKHLEAARRLDPADVAAAAALKRLGAR